MDCISSMTDLTGNTWITWGTFWSLLVCSIFTSETTVSWTTLTYVRCWSNAGNFGLLPLSVATNSNGVISQTWNFWQECVQGVLSCWASTLIVEAGLNYWSSSGPVWKWVSQSETFSNTGVFKRRTICDLTPYVTFVIDKKYAASCAGTWQQDGTETQGLCPSLQYTHSSSPVYVCLFCSQKLSAITKLPTPANTHTTHNTHTHTHTHTTSTDGQATGGAAGRFPSIHSLSLPSILCRTKLSHKLFLQERYKLC
jgi:hypothetical protein